MDQRDGSTDLAATANWPELDAVSTSSQSSLYPSQLRDASQETATPLNGFSNRDLLSVQYVKAQLDQGDTLVFVRFPNNEPVYDTTGFELRTKHTVHSEKLLESGSKYFTETLQSREQQLRLQRRFGLVGRLPEGIKYLLDLTPPEEGDDALLLTAHLCCSLGIRKWHKTGMRCGVSRDLIGGRDEVQRLLDADSRDDTLEYCPIRHRTGIERLLQAIEGKNPRLDSAPKVWTLIVLAHHFGCTKLVEDHVLSWLLAEPNTRFMEILPEATLRIGIMLENEFLAKFAFSILVSEEALRLGSGNFYRHYEMKSIVAKKAATNKKNTRFGRPIEDILDDEWTNIIQYAGQAFSSRIHQQVTDLLHPDVKWITELPEYQKLLNAEKFLREGVDPRDHLGANTCFLNYLEFLHEGIRHFVRGSLLSCMVASLKRPALDRMQLNRKAENYLFNTKDYMATIYDSLNDQERALACPFWNMIRSLDWSLQPRDNEIFEKFHLTPMKMQREEADSESYNVRLVTTVQIERLVRLVNLAIFHMTKHMGYHGGVLPSEAEGNFIFKSTTGGNEEDTAMSGQDIDENVDATSTILPSTPDDDEENPPTTDMSRLTISGPGDALAFLHDQNVSEDQLLKHYDNCVDKGLFPSDELIGNDSPLFNLTRLFTQIRDLLDIVCLKNLQKGDNDEFSVSLLCDTLLSLSDKEYAFLPLWAGGMNDGSGGVFAGNIPMAERGAPSEPGPFYHTGSTLASAASSETGIDGERYSFVGASSTINSFSYVGNTSTAGDTSMDVQYGEDTHLDRRTVISMDDDASLESFTNTGTEEVEGTVSAAAPVVGTQAVVPSFIDDVNFFNTPDGEDDPMSEDDGDMTETED